MRADRLVTILLLLQSRPRVSAPLLARELEVSERTVLRDLEALGIAGVPIVSIRGSQGGFELAEGFRTQLTGLTNEEAEALPLMGLPGAAAVLGMDSALSRARLKVTQSLSSPGRDAAESFAGAFLHDSRPWSGEEPVERIRFLRAAIWRRREIELGVEGGADAVALRPFALVLKAGEWFVVGEEKERELRVFAVEDLAQVRTTGGRFERPVGFDLAAVWEGWVTTRLGDRGVERLGFGRSDGGLGWLDRDR